MLEKFNSFTDKGNKITPALASDWKIKYRSGRNNYLLISSEELNQSFDVLTASFLKDCENKNLTVVGNKLQGSLIFSKSRDIYTDEEYYEWEDKKEINKSIEIKKKDLIPGEICTAENGEKYYFLAEKYISKYKDGAWGISNQMKIENNDFSKIARKYLFIVVAGVDGINKVDDWNFRKYCKYNLTSRILEVEQGNLTDIKIDNLIKRFYDLKKEIAYFEDYKTVEEPIYEYSNRQERIITI